MLVGLFIGAFVLGATLGATTSAITQAAENDWDLRKINWGVVICDALYGGVSGALAVSGMGMFASCITGAALNGLQYLTTAAISGDEINGSELAISMGLGFLGGLVPKTGVNAFQLNGKYTTAANKLLTAKSIKKILQYEFKKKAVKNEIITSAIGYSVATIGFSATSFGLTSI